MIYAINELESGHSLSLPSCCLQSTTLHSPGLTINSFREFCFSYFNYLDDTVIFIIIWNTKIITQIFQDTHPIVHFRWSISFWARHWWIPDVFSNPWGDHLTRFPVHLFHKIPKVFEIGWLYWFIIFGDFINQLFS